MKNLSAPSPTLRVCSLFSGIGGFELGLSRNGHRPILFCDNDRQAHAVLASQFPQVPILNDVREIDTLPKCDLLTAGWPCQDLSLAGRVQGITGAKSSLIDEVFRLLKQTPSKPRYVILENVAFAANLHNGAALSHIIESFESIGYNWAFRILDTRAFGLPQRRRRLYFLASIAGLPECILFDGIHAPQPAEMADPLLVGFYWTEGTRGTGWSPEAVPPLKGGSSLGIPSPPAIWDVVNGAFITPSIEDAERLQGFPVNWTKSAGSEKGRRWVLIGNAVSVPIAEWLGFRLAHGINEPLCEELLLSGATDSASSRGKRAAFGGPGRETKILTKCSEGPGVPSYRRLSQFGLLTTTPLSNRALQGFSRRFQASSLRKNPIFLNALLSSIQKQSVYAM